MNVNVPLYTEAVSSVANPLRAKKKQKQNNKKANVVIEEIQSVELVKQKQEVDHKQQIEKPKETVTTVSKYQQYQIQDESNDLNIVEAESVVSSDVSVEITETDKKIKSSKIQRLSFCLAKYTWIGTKSIFSEIFLFTDLFRPSKYREMNEYFTWVQYKINRTNRLFSFLYCTWAATMMAGGFTDKNVGVFRLSGFRAERENHGYLYRVGLRWIRMSKRHSFGLISYTRNKVLEYYIGFERHSSGHAILTAVTARILIFKFGVMLAVGSPYGIARSYDFRFLQLTELTPALLCDAVRSIKLGRALCSRFIKK